MAKAAAKEKVENQFDERRETLVVETKTTVDAGLVLEEPKRERLAVQLHQRPKDAKRLEYIRCPTGLIRHITITADDLARLETN